jgi:hypothetical protein
MTILALKPKAGVTAIWALITVMIFGIDLHTFTRGVSDGAHIVFVIMLCAFAHDQLGTCFIAYLY